MASPFDFLGPTGSALSSYSEARNRDALLKRQLAQEEEDRPYTLEERSLKMQELRSRAEREMALAHPELAAAAKQKDLDERSRKIIEYAKANKIPISPQQELYIRMNGDLPPEFLKPPATATKKPPILKTDGSGNFWYETEDPVTGTPKMEPIPRPKGFVTPEERAGRVTDAREQAKVESRRKAVKDLQWPSYMKERYATTGQKPQNVPTIMLKEARANELALDDASKIMEDVKTLAKNSTNPNGLGSWLGDRFANAQYRTGFSPGGVYKDLASRLSRFSIKAMTSGAMGSRLTVQVIKLLTPHLPDLGTDNAENIHDKMATIVSDLLNNQSVLKTQMETYYGQDLPTTLPGAEGLISPQGRPLQPGD